MSAHDEVLAYVTQDIIDHYLNSCPNTQSFNVMRNKVYKGQYQATTIYRTCMRRLYTHFHKALRTLKNKSELMHLQSEAGAQDLHQINSETLLHTEQMCVKALLK